MTNSLASPKLYWLASYPKSGNTWTRAFIANLLNEDPDPVDINELNTGAIASGRGWVQAAFDFNIDELSHDEVDQLRPLAYQWLSDQAEDFEYHKTHDAYSYLDSERNQPLFPKEATAGALVIVRNPLDVAVSFSNHNRSSLEKTIENMANPEFSFCGKDKKLFNQLRQWLWSWSDFNQSWMEAPIPKKIVRYEDMKANPIETFTQIATFLKLPNDRDNIIRAIEACKIEKLQAQEQSDDFKEKPAKVKSFFRKGVVGDWQNHLNEEQVQGMITTHESIMRELNYLDEQGELIL